MHKKIARRVVFMAGLTLFASTGLASVLYRNQITLFREIYGVYLPGQHDEILNNYLHDRYHDGTMLTGQGDPIPVPAI